MKTLTNAEIKELCQSLKEHLGAVLKTDDFVFIKAGEDKIRATTPETMETAPKIRGVQLVGLYVGKKRKQFSTLTIEGCMLLSDVEEAYVVNLTREQALAWMKGGPVALNTAHRTVIGRYRRFCLGTALVDRTGKAYPQIPVWRRIPPASD
ncbi:MAG: hypothetical protein RMK31_08215 [Candidatus Caldarchaeum sp.]|nr:hypothetical protein [Candidatus Caldarchaeum sp.]